jgi:membrane-bound lytic murein transglycosylase F
VHPEIAVALDVTDEQPVTWFSQLDDDQTLLPRCSISSTP